MKDGIKQSAKISLLLIMLFSMSAMFSNGQVSVLTQHNDNARTGQNLNETTLNISNVNVNGFGKLFWRTVDGFIYAQPLYVPGLTIQGGTHNVVFVATEHNSVYAFDADDPNQPAPLWQVNLGTPVPSQDICIVSGDTNPADCPYYDISPEIGITSTPVIDPVAGIIYVVNRTKNTSNSTYHDYLHALNLTTGAEELGGPVELMGQVNGTGTGSSGGVVAFQPVYQHQRPALLLENGVLYIAFGSVGDIGGVYHGWVMSYNASTLQQEAIFNVTPNGDDGGIWNSGQGPVADSSGNVYLMTGNGDFTANTGGLDYGDSFLKFGGSGLTVSDYFTPDTQASLAANNEDLGSGGPMLMPGTSLIVGMGKDGIMRVVNTNNMGHYSSAVDNDVQDFTATPNAFFSSPVYWDSPNHGPLIYIWGGGDYLKAFQFNGSTFNTTAVSEGTILNSSGDPNAAAMSISADGSMAGTGILWATGSISQWAKGTQVPGYVRAFDATNLTDELWDSTQNLARDDVGNSAKLNPPTITNGKVYVGSFSGQLQVYGLNPPSFQGIQFVQVASATPQSTTVSVPVTFSSLQTAGDLNVVIVGWNDTTAAVQSVTDSAGNTYTLALGPTKGTGLSESIYYAKNIFASGSNTVTVTFNQGATKPDVRILEYSGVATSNPLDVSTGASGSTYIADSGYVNTNAANELIVGASMVQGTTTVMAGAPFTPRVITSPNSDVAADRLVNVPGSYHSWAPLNASGPWVSQVVTFRAANSGTVPFVSGVSPSSGSTSGGTAVTITGTNFAAGATVTFGAAAGTNVTVVNSTTITATTPAGSAGAATVTVTVNGQSGSLAGGFTYVAPPTVTSISPSSGSTSGGTAVTITGTNFAAGATVTFGSNAATNVTVVNSTTITATTPADSAGAVTVTVTNLGSQSGSLANGYTYTVTPGVTGVSPNTGPTAGGTAVTITGANFATGATVTFGSNAATSVTVVNSTTITATTPAGAAGAVTVTVTVGGQSGNLSGGYTYIGTPTVTSVSPNNGPAAGGTAVTITGTNFAAGATVTFGNNAATNVTVVNSTTITATTPAGSAGAVTVTVTNIGSQSGSQANGFTYNAAVAISFAQVASATPQSSTATVSVAYPAAQTAGDLNVVAVGWNDTTSTVTSVKDSAGNTYKLAIGPTTGTGLLQSIYYAANIAGGGNTVTVTFNQAAAYPDIRILEYRGVTTLDVIAGASGSGGSANSGAATTTSANELIFGADLVATTTTAAGSGFTSRIITSPDGDIAEDKIVTTAGSNSATATLSGTGAWVMQMVTFSATPPPVPTVTSVSPNSGSTAGGTAVTITGTNFVSGATVSFGSTAATNVTVVNSTTIAATTPAGTAGAVTVTVTNSGGQSGNLASGFTYVAGPAVTSVNPNGGPVAGGTSVTITGTNFASGATVTFGSAAATNVTVVSSTSITATTPGGSSGAVTVTVTNSNGLSGSLASGFTYAPAPTVTSVSPNTGPTTGGTAITITGTNFAPGAVVEMVETRRQATNVVVVNSTTITAVTPTGDAGAVTVSVTVNGQSGNLANGFTYVVQPTVTSVSPNSGSNSGGTAVTITGTNFAAGATVTFGSNAASNVVVVNSTTITATTPAGTTGAVTVTVTVGGQSGSLSGAYTYIGTPTVTSVSPNNGPAAGGTAVTITGTNFATGATVKFGSSAATSVVVVSSTTITATTPAGTVGAATVTVTNVASQSGSLVNGFTYNASVAIGFAQVASATPQTASATVSVSYPAAQTAGDLNVVAVGWNDTTSTVTSVKDSAGNAYNLAIGPTTGTGMRQSIYYAANIAGGTNTVTVTFSQAASFPDVRILEYRGVTTLDVKAGASGSSTSASSGSATTTSANELVFGADYVSTTTKAAGSGFTSRIITKPDGDIAEDKVVTTTGSTSATATLTSSGPWVMQMATFSAVSNPVPTVTSVSPNSGSTGGGTAVTITGANFASGATVKFGSNAATNVTVVNSTTITATTPASSAGAVTVTVTVNGQSGSLTSGFTYIAPPTVTSVSPNSGSNSGGTPVTITGTNFAAGATVTFGSNAATNVTVVNSTTITATTPAGSAGVATVTVTVNGQSGSLTSGYTYVVAPTVTSVSPNSGPTGGGTAVTITGTSFAGSATVTFGAAAATNVTVVNSTTITATTPAGSAGAATVTVTVNGQSGSLTSGYTYVVAPTVTSVSPNSGPTGGGTAVTITGTNFAAGATVIFGSNAATNVTVVNSTTITATTPAGSAGAATVTVTVNGQSGSLASGFTYVAPPTVTSVSPNSGSTGGGTAVTITGTNFASGATVTFGSNAATNVTVVNSTTITATTPAGSVGAVTVTVTVNGQSGSLASGFTYVAPPTVTSVSPNSGSTGGGTPVTITGTNFASGATVAFGSNASTNVTVVNSTTITATTPAGSVGAVTVTVTVNGQSGSLASGFTYVAPPTVTSVSPNSGSTGGGTAVTITGTNFASGATVTFGSNASTNVTVVNSTTITATTPAGSVGAVTVTVTVNGKGGSLASGYTYVVAPAVTAVSPNSGSTGGGTAVTITGTNFASGATVTFGSNAATNVTVVNSTTITATTPAGSVGAVTVTVTVNGQSGSLASGFTYVAPPTVTSVSPNSGSTGGGTPVTITGTNFASGATVTFGSNAATNVTVVNSTTITATTPAGSVGAVTVTVTVNGQSGSLTNGFTYNAAVAIGFAQVASATPQSPTATVSVSYPAAQTTGDLNVVVVGWNDTTSTVTSVTDSAGNTYSLAIGPTTGTGMRQSIYYAANITGGSNTVTVTFNQAASFPDVRILEYRGVTALDVTAGASGSSTSANSGSATTTSANELIFGADLVATLTAAAGSGFTSRIITPLDGDIAEDEVVTTAGSYSATATLSGSGPWVMQLVGFVPVPGSPPAVTSVSPNNGPTTGGTSVTITGTNFRSGAMVTFGAAAAINVTVVNSTTITATTPVDSAGVAAVTVTDPDGQSGSLAGGFTFMPVPTVSSVSPNNGPVAGGTSVTITGTNFVTGATVTFGSASATNVVVVNGNTITATTSAGTAGAVTVTVTNPGGLSGSLQGGFIYGSPTVSSISPNNGWTTGGTEVMITGTNFASGATVSFGGAAATNVVVANVTTITATTPAGSAGAVTVTVTNPGGQSGSLASGFTYVVAPPTYSDNFNRASGSLGSNWTTPSSTNPATFPLQILSDEVLAANTPVIHALEYYNSGTFANNQWASETVVNAPTTGASTQAILLRSSNLNYYNDGIPFGSSYFIGPANQVDFCAVGHVGTYANGDSHALYVAGSGPVFFWSFHNGVIDATCDDTANNIAGGNPGIGMAADQNATPTMAAGNWEGGSLDSFSSSASDNFFRANAGWLGVNWWFTPIDPAAGFVNAFYTLTNNAAVLSSTGSSQYGAAIWTTALTGNQSAVTIGAYGSSGDFVGPVVRYSMPNGNSVSSTTAFYFAEAKSSGQVEIFAYSGGNFNLLSNLGTYGGTVSTLELDASGTSPVTLTVKVNGSTFGLPYNDSTYKLTGTYDGFTTFGTSSTTVTSWSGN